MFHNCTHLTHEFVGSTNGSVLDSATLFKNRTCPGLTGAGTTSSSGNESGTGGATSSSSTSGAGSLVGYSVSGVLGLVIVVAYAVCT